MEANGFRRLMIPNCRAVEAVALARRSQLSCQLGPTPMKRSGSPPRSMLAAAGVRPLGNLPSRAFLFDGERTMRASPLGLLQWGRLPCLNCFACINDRVCISEDRQDISEFGVESKSTWRKNRVTTCALDFVLTGRHCHVSAPFFSSSASGN